MIRPRGEREKKKPGERVSESTLVGLTPRVKFLTLRCGVPVGPPAVKQPPDANATLECYSIEL